MASSLFPAKSQPPNPQNNLPMAVKSIMQQLRGGNPQQILMQLMRTDPQINAFMRQFQNATPQQIAQQLGVDYNFLTSLIK